MSGWGPQSTFPLCKGFDILKRSPSVLGPTATPLLTHFETEDLAFELLEVLQGDLPEGRSLGFFCYTPHHHHLNPRNILSTQLGWRGLAHGSWPRPAGWTEGHGTRQGATLGKPRGRSHTEVPAAPESLPVSVIVTTSPSSSGPNFPKP